METESRLGVSWSFKGKNKERKTPSGWSTGGASTHVLKPPRITEVELESDTVREVMSLQGWLTAPEIAADGALWWPELQHLLRGRRDNDLEVVVRSQEVPTLLPGSVIQELLMHVLLIHNESSQQPVGGRPGGAAGGKGPGLGAGRGRVVWTPAGVNSRPQAATVPSGALNSEMRMIA